jgi:hypothetical protein
MNKENQDFLQKQKDMDEWQANQRLEEIKRMQGVLAG